MSKSAVMRGLDKMQKRLKTKDFVAKPAGPFLRDWREDVKQEAIARAPRWKENLVGSIQSAQDSAKFPLWARVYSDSPHARWADLGTGVLSEDPESAKQAYFPPPEALEPWAQDHGSTGYLVARGIFIAGGTEPTHFFRDAYAAANDRMNAKLGRFSTGIVNAAGMNV